MPFMEQLWRTHYSKMEMAATPSERSIQRRQRKPTRWSQLTASGLRSSVLHSPTRGGFTSTAGDFLVHHAIALGLHTTTLVLVKAAVNSRSSKLMPDKVSFGSGFPCDGPGRGGTCDISAFDGLYLAIFWMLNTVGWITFYWHWKHLALASNSVGMWRDGSLYLMGWLRDYLWLNSSQLINGYGPSGISACAVWDWMFLFGHLVWATGFMFLISWRGYWQELNDRYSCPAGGFRRQVFVGLGKRHVVNSMRDDIEAVGKHT